MSVVRESALQSVNELLKECERAQRKKLQVINPRIHARQGAKREVDLYVVCRKNPTSGQCEIALSGRRGVSLVQAELFLNPSGKFQAHPSKHGPFPASQVPELAYEGLLMLLEKEGDEQPKEGFYNPYMDGYYIIRPRGGKAGKDGLANMAGAVKAGLISQEFADLLIAWGFSMMERKTDHAYIAAKKAKTPKRKKL